MRYLNLIPLITFICLLTSCKHTNKQLLDKAYDLSKQKQYDKAIEIYNEVIKRNSRLQLPYYNRGFAYLGTKNYQKALDDFNEVMNLQTHGGFVVTINKDLYPDEEVKDQVPYNDALYERAQTEFYLDSLKNSFGDFQNLVDNNYQEKSNCLLWQGVVWIKNGNNDKACACFAKAKEFALTDDDTQRANEMIKTYCGQTNNNR